jgi:hypothetical protein
MTAATLVIVRPMPPNIWPLPPCPPAPLPFTHLALALCLALVGVSLANLLITLGVTILVAYNLALPLAVVGLVIAAVMFYREVLWSARI